MKKAGKFLRKEPVMLGAAVYATFEAAWPDAPPAVKIAAGLWVAYFQRLWSTPAERAKQREAEAAKAGRDEAVAQISALPEPNRRQLVAPRRKAR